MILKYKCVAVHRGVGWAIADFEVENDGSVEAWSGDTPRAKMSVPVTNPKLLDAFVEGKVYGVDLAMLENDAPLERMAELNAINVVEKPKTGKARSAV